ncbi:hypothetical protein [Geomicrobium sediminis]|uniref:Cobalamin biosynthesis Co2+ chelatase CbiK n=1 Tax=Geomicrobium sediminis TaxID=1347788 RepID=A0ABS2PES6_9BACL|nr:hypothetical protein [Geomicrobium sediminis]EZH67914.1 hypothetical protein DH09_08315 [Bacillaceae bacterium JMAK1]MBM7633851.1 cobalamin biosynthesis Co2+ chelatase CbiK [Geomicrobium sediminis]
MNIQSGEVVMFEGEEYEVLTKTSTIINDDFDSLGLTRFVIWLENLRTGKCKFVFEEDLEELVGDSE